MSEQPKFLRDSSKRENPDERNEVAAQIREARAERFNAHAGVEQETPEESPISESAERAVENYKALDAEVSSLNDSGVNQIHDLTSWVGIKQRLATGGNELQMPAQFNKPKQLLDDFYAKERERWASSKGSPEEMKQLFTEEHLASLPMDQYALLLKHFPNAMVTHVTRQGIRDHVGMFEHTKGEGQYADGFMQILQGGELKSPLAIAVVEQGKEAAIAKAIRLDDAESQAEAEERLQQSLSGAFDGYADRAAVHVATEAVADHFYGSEKGNEIFIAFPSAHVAAEHQFVGDLSEARDLKNNDTWILRDNALDKGMNINAGVAFIPAEARVDATTGSRYALDERKRPIENQALRSQIDSLLSNEEVQQWAQEDYENERTPEETAEILRSKFGVEDPRVQDAISRKANEIRMLKTYQEKYPPEEVERRKKMIADDTLERTGMRYQEAENTVSSEEFWEVYFAQHPERRPTKVEYYKGDDPTHALLMWKQKHGLTDAGSEASYDVGGRVDVETYQSQDKDRFQSIAEKVIQERFAQASAPAVVEQIPSQPASLAKSEDETYEDWQIRVRKAVPPPPPPPPTS